MYKLQALSVAECLVPIAGVRRMLDESDFTRCRASDVNMLENLVRFVIVKLNSVSISAIMEAKSLILAVILL